MGSIEPLSQRMAEELQNKLDIPSLDFDFSSLWAHDVVGRSQAFSKLVASGMPVEQAANVSGIIT